MTWEHVACFVLLMLACCAQLPEQHIQQQIIECKQKGGVPSVYVKHPSITKAQGVYCDDRQAE